MEGLAFVGGAVSGKDGVTSVDGDQAASRETFLGTHKISAPGGKLVILPTFNAGCAVVCLHRIVTALVTAVLVTCFTKVGVFTIAAVGDELIVVYSIGPRAPRTIQFVL